MELKEYQKKALEQVKRYLEVLAEYKAKNEKAIQVDPDLSINFPLKAWEKVVGTPYLSKKNGIGEYLPDFYLKIPTGGGKTLLACHTIDLINRTYLKKQTGIVLWIVPTTQIYRQTLANLKNREHPYRQVLDIASGGRTVILEKTDRFTPLDVEENLLVMLLMLPSASRQNKEVLKVFKDSGGFAEFFPPEDDRDGHEKLLKQFPNLDYFGDENNFWGRIVKTSLGNVLRILRPVIIIDEGHKAYSSIAQETIRGFNPAIIVELSATPPKYANILVSITGQELNREEMIKLDLHITNKASLDWKDAMLAAVEKRNILEQKAKEYEANTGEYIRPICLVQVERTGREQKGTKYIHAEDVKEYLIKQCGIREEEIAIKSSEKDDIEGIDLLGKDCPVRYIITRQALQEGWDCAFAYVLAILTNPTSQLSITQLVGRILRQPRARKTKVKELDESYVFCYRQRAKEVLEGVKAGFEAEGLGDLAGRVSVDLVKQKILCFFLLSSQGGYKLPIRIKVRKTSKSLVRHDNTPIQRSLFDFVPEEDFNEMEKAVAIYLDEQEKLLWWYRNLSRKDYYIQGWKKHKIYPDFIFADTHVERQDDYGKVYVIETKGLHLKNEDTDYKKNVFDFCNRLGQQKDWRELNLEFDDKKIEFQVIYEDEWKARINKIFGI